MMDREYKRIIASLTHEEQQRLFDILRKYNWIMAKLERGEQLRKVEDDFLFEKPHKVTDELAVDYIEGRIVYVSW